MAHANDVAKGRFTLQKASGEPAAGSVHLRDDRGRAALYR